MLHRFEDPALGVCGHSVKFVERVLQHLRHRNCRLESLRDLISGLDGDVSSKRHSVAFTFDDGTYDQAEIGADLFRRYDCPATIFLITGFVDQNLWPWDDQVAYALRCTGRPSVAITVGSRTLSYDLDTDVQRDFAMEDLRLRCKALVQNEFLAVLENLSEATEVEIPQFAPHAYASMTWDDARSLERTGLFSFAPHSVSHQILTAMPEEMARREIQDSWKRVRHELARPLPVYNFPSGIFGDREVGLLREAGLSAFVTSDAGYVGSSRKAERLDLPRRFDRFVFPDTLEDFLQYSTWIEWGKQWLRTKVGNL
ncbi:MAG: polysaccharide deacetylase family protein [Acidiferrobacterales bacterium]